MNKPYKYALGKEWWTKHYGKVLLTKARCFYTVEGSEKVEYSAKTSKNRVVELVETDLSVAAEDLNKLQAEIYAFDRPTDAEKEAFWKETNEAYAKLKNDDLEITDCHWCGGSGKQMFRGNAPEWDEEYTCKHCDGSGKATVPVKSIKRHIDDNLVMSEFKIPDEDSIICTECFGMGRVTGTWIESGKLKCNSLNWQPITDICSHCNGTGKELDLLEGLVGAWQPPETAKRTEPPTQDRVDDLVEQVKSVLKQAEIGWDSHIHLCRECGMDVEFEPYTIAFTYLVDLQRALRAYLGEEKP
jgi:hypothetical protein